MCGVLGFQHTKPDAAILANVRMLFKELGIRGLHATGVSYVYKGQVYTKSAPVPVYKFLEDNPIEDFLDEDGSISMIGHCRYSTSDLEYNQPIQINGTAVAHNGIVTQESSEKWESLYGYLCEGKNDTELLARALDAGEDPFSLWPNISASICLLTQNTLMATRNGKRPLWYAEVPGGVVFSSTRDSFARAGFVSMKRMNDGTVATVVNGRLAKVRDESHVMNDLQP